MCAIIGQVQFRFESLMPPSWSTFHFPVPQYNLWTGGTAYVITPKEEWIPMAFGFYLQKGEQKRWFFNYRWESFQRKTLPSHQWLPAIVPVNYFIEGTDEAQLKSPYLYKHKHNSMLLLVALMCEQGFVLLTTSAPPFIQQRGKSRSPLLLDIPTSLKWLQGQSIVPSVNQIPLTGYSISPKITTKQNDPSLVQPYLSLF